jgi:hypothetical protein
LRKIYFGGVDENIRVYPNHKFLVFINKDHVFVEYKIAIVFTELFGGADYLESNLKGRLIGV